ncbi:MAG: hypothetical protein HY332_21880 [Chloroflexi bacterium]|nr:hypothetical protein [Chloroflexota bacterium]
MHRAQVAHDHEHQRFEEQAIRVGRGAPAGALRRRRWDGDAVEEQEQGDQQRGGSDQFGYHPVASVLWCGNRTIRGRRGRGHAAAAYL